FKCFSRQEPAMRGRMPPEAKPKFPFLLLEPTKSLPESVQCSAPPHAGSRIFGSGAKSSITIQVSRTIYLPKNIFKDLQYQLTGSEEEHTHATMGQNCSLGARALTLGDLRSADGSVLGKLGCPMAHRVFGIERRDTDTRRHAPSLHGG